MLPWQQLPYFSWQQRNSLSEATKELNYAYKPLLAGGCNEIATFGFWLTDYSLNVTFSFEMANLSLNAWSRPESALKVSLPAVPFLLYVYARL